MTNGLSLAKSPTSRMFKERIVQIENIDWKQEH